MVTMITSHPRVDLRSDAVHSAISKAWKLDHGPAIHALLDACDLKQDLNMMFWGVLTGYVDSEDSLKRSYENSVFYTYRTKWSSESTKLLTQVFSCK
jgi:hypothetical protein